MFKLDLSLALEEHARIHNLVSSTASKEATIWKKLYSFLQVVSDFAPDDFLDSQGDDSNFSSRFVPFAEGGLVAPITPAPTGPSKDIDISFNSIIVNPQVVKSRTRRSRRKPACSVASAVACKDN